MATRCDHCGRSRAWSSSLSRINGRIYGPRCTDRISNRFRVRAQGEGIESEKCLDCGSEFLLSKESKNKCPDSDLCCGCCSATFREFRLKCVMSDI